MARKSTRSDAVRNRQRTLDAAAAVFAEQGVSASTETIAARAGVGVGTVFRHFPTKASLLSAVLAHMFDELIEAAGVALAAQDPGTAFFDLLQHIVEQAGTKRAIADVLGSAAKEMSQRVYLGGLRETIAELLARAQAAGAVRDDVGVDEVVAVIAAALRAAEHAVNNASLQRRVVGVVFDGLRPR